MGFGIGIPGHYSDPYSEVALINDRNQPTNQKPELAVYAPARRLLGGEVYLFLPKYYGSQLFRFDRTRQQFLPLRSNFPADWTPVDMFQDRVGNICFLFQDKQGGYRALIEDQADQRFDYTAMVSGHANIINIVAQDFRKQAFIMGNDGLHSVGIQKSGAIEHALSGQWISSMAFRSERELLVNTITEGWFRHDTLARESVLFTGPDCGLALSPFGKGMKQQIIPDAQVDLWFLSFDHLVRYDPGNGDCQAFALSFRGQLLGFVRPDLILLQHDRTKLSLFDIKNEVELPLEDWMPTDLEGFMRDIFRDAGGKIWIPTNKGLWKLDFDQRQADFKDFRFTAIYEAPRDAFGWGLILAACTSTIPKRVTYR